MNYIALEKVIKNYIVDNTYILGGINCMAADLLIFKIDWSKSTYVYNDFLVINNNKEQKFRSVINPADWRLKLENEGIDITEAYFKNRYIENTLDNIPNNITINNKIPGRLLTLIFYSKTPIDDTVQIIKRKEYDGYIVEITQLKNMAVICYITFKKRLHSGFKFQIY